MTSINTNIGALVAQKNMMENSKDMDQAMARISSGLRINSAADDAAGSAIASKMEAQVRSLDVAIRNANDAISLTQTAEGSLGEIENILQRMRELSVQAGNSTLNSSDRSQIQAEMDQLASEIDSISTKTNFNGVKLLDGTRSSLDMQVGISENDKITIGLQKTTVGALGIGNSGSTGANVVISERMTTLVDQAAGDIKINGEDAFASLFDVNSTAVKGSTDNVSGAVSGANLDNGQYGALALATHINTNTSKHGVTADAFNEVRAGTNVYTAESFAINGVTVASQNTKELWVAEVNNMINNITAKIDAEGFIVYSNTDGATINFAANKQGITADNYGGFVRLTGSGPITIEAGSEENGYGADTGDAVDVKNIGFNEIRSSADGVGLSYTGGSAVDESVLQGSDGVRINDVLITKLAHHTSTSIHATDKVAAINAKTNETGVVASASTGVIVGVDMSTPTMTNHADLVINGITVDMTSVDTTKELVDTINTAMVGKTDVVASLHTDGNLKLFSASGSTISADDDANDQAAGALFKSAVNLDGTAIVAATGAVYASGGFTAHGRLTLTSLDGSSIKVTDDRVDILGNGDTSSGGVSRIGFNSTNEFRDSGATGVVVSSVEAASSSLARLDDAIDTVSQFRAGFGAFENRLDASINNLTTLKVNTDAARSRIEDADFAAETSNLTKSQILAQAATSMLAQANASKQNLLALLQG
ncbi:flagellin [Alphaproteobacteria bacterium]|nr:flagellin [Alphaproteobacteria bacterium]